jgi:hypothetical protein
MRSSCQASSHLTSLGFLSVSPYKSLQLFKTKIKFKFPPSLCPLKHQPERYELMASIVISSSPSNNHFLLLILSIMTILSKCLAISSLDLSKKHLSLKKLTAKRYSDNN